MNWNTTNEGLAVTDYEFIVNRTGRGGKRPDYTLQLDGQHLLVMDAKQVKYDMHDPRWLNQVYAYGYSTQNLAPVRRIDFAVLTDFEEFVVLDCTLHVNDPRALRNFLVLNWTCDDYVNQFDRLWDLFERENMRRTARTRHSDTPRGLWALALSPRKVKANRTPPDKAFLADMDNDKNGWRVRLAKDMKKLNPAADGNLITAAVQLLIDRLIFVKALSDREIEDDYLDQLAATIESDGLAESDNGWFAACRKIFDKLNRFYNGNIFKPRPELEAMVVANKTVHDIIRSLHPENSPYNFAVLPVEILGTIYERFLGRVVRTTEQRVKIEEKPEVRKAGGVYYTPQYIVEYIVKNTVGKLLENCQTPADVVKLKILDPACGSGSFLVGAYAFLIDWHIKYYDTKKRLSASDRADAYYDSDGRVRLTARLKRQILINNLFGVDIDQQAVEVTRFSLSLKALEDTRREELYEERSLFKETVLPDLNDNIKCGNSLIGPDYFSGKMFPDSEELRRINPFDWQREFPTIFSSGGFDAVIGNPPYIRIQTLKESNPEQVKYLKGKFRAAGSGNYDIYVVFVEKGLALLNPSGRLGFILPHKFFNSKYGAPLRGVIAEGKHLSHVVHFGDQQVFDGATTYTALMFLDKAGCDLCEFVKVSDLEVWQAELGMMLIPLALSDSRVTSDSPLSSISADRITSAEWNFSVGIGSSLFERLSKVQTKLGDIAYRIYQGPITSADSVYLFKDFRIKTKNIIEIFSKELNKWIKIEASILKNVVRSGDINKFWANPTALVLFPYEVKNNSAQLFSQIEMKKKFPLAWEYLNKNKKILENREKNSFCDAQWYRFGRTQNLGLWEQPKLMIPYMVTNLNAFFDEDRNYYFINVTTGGYGITVNEKIGSYRYICGLLNSRLLNFYFKRVSTNFHGGYFAANKQYIEQLPIRTIDVTNPNDKAQHDLMVSLVESIQGLQKLKAAAKTQTEQEMIQRQTDATDREINKLVYELYSLSEDEVRIVET
ncbi:MAG: Eco57I restriction-modification methylase domain-containing protein [Thermodesulfovibrionales bacterium]|nr:Eco57I restriction-modification methylase domain-containing protein [Thermodesulfovibrionales bacterium]